MDVHRITKLFKRLMDFFPNEIKAILAVVESDYFDNRDVETSFVAAEHIDEDNFKELQQTSLAISRMSFNHFHVFFNGGRVSACKDIMEEMEKEDIDLTFDILELVIDTEGSRQDKFSAVFAKYRALLTITHEGRALLEEMRKYIK